MSAPVFFQSRFVFLGKCHGFPFYTTSHYNALGNLCGAGVSVFRLHAGGLATRPRSLVGSRTWPNIVSSSDHDGMGAQL